MVVWVQTHSFPTQIRALILGRTKRILGCYIILSMMASLQPRIIRYAKKWENKHDPHSGRKKAISSSWLWAGPDVDLTKQRLQLAIINVFQKVKENVILMSEQIGPLNRETETVENNQVRTSLVAQWLRICLPVQGTRVRSLVQEDPTYHGATKPVCQNYWACTTTTEACAPRAHAPQQEKPLLWEACAPRWRVPPAHGN